MPKKKVPVAKKPVAKKAPAPKAPKKTKAQTAEASEDKKASAKKRAQSLALLRGMKDVSPEQGDMFMNIFRSADSIATDYGFKYTETPIVEYTSLFVRSIGKGTDVVDKEMYVFEDRDGDKVCLRPEVTAAVARAYIMHGMQSLPQPVKMWYWGPMFRYDRPQAGRYREFHQFGCETIGEHNPVIDAELISVAYNLLRDLGIASTVHINSIGTLEEREQYVVELVGYLRSKRSYLSEHSKARIAKNPLRVLDSKEPEDQQVIEEAPQIIDWLSDTSKNFFMKTLEYLDEVQIPYAVTPTLVRGLDYYSDTVFEIFADDVEQSQQSALVGGGRYNGLIEQLGGNPTPGAGFSFGVERVMSLLEKKQKQIIAENGGLPPAPKREGLYFAQLGEQASRRALFLIEQLRRDGIRVYHSLAKSSLKTQMELADKFGVTHALILGQKEVLDNTILLRDMDSGIQEVIDQNKLKQTLKKTFGY